MRTIEVTVDEVCKQMSWSGNLPISPETNDHKVQVCLGAPGAIPMLTEAMWVFPRKQEKLLEIALKAGEITWQFGLVRKGNGICHGISGNGYMLHCLHRAIERLAKQADKNNQKP